MIDNQRIALSPCYSPLHELRQKRTDKSLALLKAQAEVRSLLDDLEYLDYRIETVRECFMDEMAKHSCRFDPSEDFYQ